MAKHTPGPWNKNSCYIYAPDGKIIAQVHNPGSKKTDYPLEANRDLMAAAPELLAALEALTDWGREHTSPRDDNSPHLLLIAAMEALTKATD
jgi:hypothetical protein